MSNFQLMQFWWKHQTPEIKKQLRKLKFNLKFFKNKETMIVLRDVDDMYAGCYRWGISYREDAINLKMIDVLQSDISSCLLNMFKPIR